MDQIKFIASPASRSEPRSCGRDPSDSPRKSNITLSLNWSMPYQGGCSQVPISSKGFDSSICDWKNKFSFLFGKYHLFRIESFRVDIRCVHRLQLLKVCDQYVTVPSSPRQQKRFRGTIQLRLCFQIDGFLTGASQLQSDTQPMKQVE